jgi:hypothetical protein
MSAILGVFGELGCRQFVRRPDELPPDKERDRGDEDRQRDEEVEPEAEVVVRAEIDPQRLLVATERGVEGDVERE